MRDQEIAGLWEAYFQVHQPKEEVEQLDENIQGAVKGALEKGAKFMKTNPVGKAVSNIIAPVGSGRKTPTATSGGYRKEEIDLFDTILDHLVAEGYADTNESALAIMANMSEEWRQSIVEGMSDFLPKSTTVIPGKYGKNTVLSKKGGVEGVSDKSKPGSFTPQKGGFDRMDAERYATQHSKQGTSSGTSGINLAGRRETPGRVK